MRRFKGGPGSWILGIILTIVYIVPWTIGIFHIFEYVLDNKEAIPHF